MLRTAGVEDGPKLQIYNSSDSRAMWQYSLWAFHFNVIANAAEDTNTRHRRWTTAKLSHIPVPFNWQQRNAFFSFMSFSPLPVCLLHYFLPNVDRNFERPGFNVFVLTLDLAFVLKNIFPHLVPYFWLCPSFRDRNSANILKYTKTFVAVTL